MIAEVILNNEYMAVPHYFLINIPTTCGLQYITEIIYIFNVVGWQTFVCMYLYYKEIIEITSYTAIHLVNSG